MDYSKYFNKDNIVVPNPKPQMTQLPMVSNDSLCYQDNTKNTSFIETHCYLKALGIENNKFFLVLNDPDLKYVDVYDPNLDQLTKQKILRECMCNYWYFLREVVRIPDQGGNTGIGAGIRYKLHRGNLAVNFCLKLNLNIFAEFPRQHGKTYCILVRLLWEFLFGTTNSESMLINKKHGDAKLNLSRLKEIRDVLPLWLRTDTVFGTAGLKKPKSNVETLEHAHNRNKLVTLSSARNAISADSLGRGCTQPRQWYDEYAFIPYNEIIYQSATPAFKKASLNAKANNAPYGIIITTTPGDLTTEHGDSAYKTKNDATQFDEKWYDYSIDKINKLLSKNTKSSFIYIRYTYKQLGSGEDWFRDIVVDMKQDWNRIRREVLLEWAKTSDNSPFKKEDLDTIRTMIKEPVRQITLFNYFTLNVYRENLMLRYPPIIGVDVAGGLKRDSSTITVIDSYDTSVVADFNCNYISPNDLASVIYELVIQYFPDAVVNIERNGGFGINVISTLMKTKIKRNLFYEIKDRVVEERFNGAKMVKKTQKSRVYGTDSTKNTRDLLMEILSERVEHHKDKFISNILFDELNGLEVKKNGRIEHSSKTHDDQVFSYLLAMYVWYHGTDLMERYGISKRQLKTDSAYEEGLIPLEEQYADIFEDISIYDSETQKEVKRDLDELCSCTTKTFDEWLSEQNDLNNAYMSNLLSTKLGRQAYSDTYNIPVDDIQKNSIYNIPDDVFLNFNNIK